MRRTSETPFSLSSAWLERFHDYLRTQLSTLVGERDDLMGNMHSFAAILVRTLSEIYDADLVSDPVNWYSSFSEGSPLYSDDGATWVHVQWMKQGYGYNTSSTGVRLSLVVLGIYCLTATCRVVQLLVSGITSTAWNSAIELLVLASRSPRPRWENLEHTSVGIDTMQSFRGPVGTRE